MAKRNKRYFYTKRIAETRLYKQLISFPYPVQTLIAKEIREADARHERNEPFMQIIKLVCPCDFYSNYRLPCRHMFQVDMYSENKILDENAWKIFNYFNKEHGVDVWIETVPVLIEENSGVENTNTRSILEFNEAVSGVKNEFYGLMENKKENEIKGMVTVLKFLGKPKKLKTDSKKIKKITKIVAKDASEEKKIKQVKIAGNKN